MPEARKLRYSGWPSVQPVPVVRPAAHIIDFPAAPDTAEGLPPDFGTAEEFYIAAQPFAPQWDWSFRES